MTNCGACDLGIGGEHPHEGFVLMFDFEYDEDDGPCTWCLEDDCRGGCL